MKKLFTLFVALMAFGFGATAQRSADLVLLNTFTTNDTINFNTGGTRGRILTEIFINRGPSALIASDTLFLKSATQAAGTFTRLRLPAGGFPVNDTLYFTDTFFFTGAPTPNPAQWCDSLWAKDVNRAVITDPNIANNRACKNIFFRQVANVGIGTVKAGQSISLYPNPAASIVNVEFVAEANEKTILAVKDIQGKTVITKDLGKLSAGSQKSTVDISGLGNGIYIIELNAASRRTVTKFVISK